MTTANMPNNNPLKNPAILLGLALGVSIFVLYNFRIEPLYSFTAPLLKPIEGFAQGAGGFFSSLLASIGDYANRNPLTAVTSIITISAALYGISGKIRADRAKASAEAYAQERIGEMQRQTMAVTQSKSAVEERVRLLEQQLLESKANDLSGALAESQSLVTQQAQQLESKATEVNALARVIEQIKKNSSTVTVVK